MVKQTDSSEISPDTAYVYKRAGGDEAVQQTRADRLHLSSSSSSSCDCESQEERHGRMSSISMWLLELKC